MITSDHCSASVFVNSWLFLINLIATGIGQSKRMLFFLFEYLISPWSSIGSWKLLCFMWDTDTECDWLHFTQEKSSLLGNKWTWLCKFLGKSSVQLGEGGLSRAYEKRGLVLFLNTAEWRGSLLGGDLSNKGAIVKENMFYFGGVGENISGLTYSWHDHVDTEKKLKRIHGPRIL